MRTGIEPVLLLLSALLMFFTVLLFCSSSLYPTDGQIFQVISGLVTGFAGALLMRVKPRTAAEETPPGMEPIQSRTDTSSTVISEKKKQD